MTAGFGRCAACAAPLVGTEPVIVAGTVEAVLCYPCATELMREVVEDAFAEAQQRMERGQLEGETEGGDDTPPW